MPIYIDYAHILDYAHIYIDYAHIYIDYAYSQFIQIATVFVMCLFNSVTISFKTMGRKGGSSRMRRGSRNWNSSNAGTSDGRSGKRDEWVRDELNGGYR